MNSEARKRREERQQRSPSLSGRPVILIHLADTDGLTVCSAQPFHTEEGQYPNIPRVGCPSCLQVSAAMTMYMRERELTTKYKQALEAICRFKYPADVALFAASAIRTAEQALAD